MSHKPYCQPGESEPAMVFYIALVAVLCWAAFFGSLAVFL